MEDLFLWKIYSCGGSNACGRSILMGDLTLMGDLILLIHGQDFSKLDKVTDLGVFFLILLKLTQEYFTRIKVKVWGV